MSVVIDMRNSRWVYTCDECEYEVAVAPQNYPLGWEERAPEFGPNYHVCSGCILLERTFVH